MQISFSHHGIAHTWLFTSSEFTRSCWNSFQLHLLLRIMLLWSMQLRPGVFRSGILLRRSLTGNHLMILRNLGKSMGALFFRSFISFVLKSYPESILSPTQNPVPCPKTFLNRQLLTPQSPSPNVPYIITVPKVEVLTKTGVALVDNPMWKFTIPKTDPNKTTFGDWGITEVKSDDGTPIPVCLYISQIGK